MKHFFKTLIIIPVFISQLMVNSFYSQASNNDIFSSVGISAMVDEITEDQAKWAYAKYLGELLQQDEIRLLSAIIWCEAGNQCEAGKQAVGIVVMNRVANENFEDDIESVIFEEGQFRPKTDGRLNKALAMYDRGELPQECVQAAIYAYNRNTTVVYNGVEIDMTPYLYFATYWSDKKITIQDHDFK